MITMNTRKYCEINNKTAKENKIKERKASTGATVNG